MFAAGIVYFYGSHRRAGPGGQGGRMFPPPPAQRPGNGPCGTEYNMILEFGGMQYVQKVFVGLFDHPRYRPCGPDPHRQGGGVGLR